MAKSKTLILPETEIQLIDDIAEYTHDPLGFVNYVYDWGEGLFKDYDGAKDWQAEFFETIRDKLSNPETRHQPIRIATSSGHGIGKAMPLNIVVDTPNGQKIWGDLKKGDYLFSRDGKPTRILSTKRYDHAPMYKVSFDDGSSTIVSSGHLWTVKGRNARRLNKDDWQTLETIELVKLGVKRKNGNSYCRQWELPSYEPVSFEHKEVSVDPYILGCWLGDGSRNKPAIVSNDACFESRLIKKGYSYSVGSKKGTTAKSYYIHGIKSKLKDLNVLDKYSFQKSVPSIYKYNSDSVRAETLRGLLDTDGEASKNGSIVFSSCSIELANDVIWLARSLGGKASMCSKPKKPYYRDNLGNKVNGKPCYSVYIRMPNKFISFYIDRKHSRVNNCEDRYRKRWIESIEQVENMDCMCVSVEAQDGLYLANDFIVTHNSAFMGMLCNWALSTCEDTKIVITSNTETQLRTKTFPELKKWFRSSINYHWWRDTATGVFSNDAKHADQWRIDAVPWSEHNTEAFAGLHNRGKRIVLLFDEASAIADKVWEVAEGALTDEGTEIIWIALGNPTRPNGRFYECFHKYRHRWITKQIDSRTVEGTNLKQAQEWADDFGEDSDFFKVRVRGQFPSSSAMQFIEMNIIDDASGRHLRKEQYDHAPVILTCDPSWTGEDDLVIGMRQGLYFKILEVMPKNENDSVPATRIAHWQDELNADATFIDMGYGTGIHSFLKTWGRKSELVAFGSKSGKRGYLNKRTEMWAEMREWLRDGGAIPPTTDKHGSVLYEELKAPERLPMIKDGIISLESKESIKKRLGFSPNIADSLALSFARPVRKRDKMESNRSNNSYGANYDPTEY
ncbi:MAG: hypothetical protein [Bacteriophage sp.]|nr:MAG: hypothetical protein [Bacteriophage sp.]